MVMVVVVVEIDLAVADHRVVQTVFVAAFGQGIPGTCVRLPVG